MFIVGSTKSNQNEIRFGESAISASSSYNSIFVVNIASISSIPAFGESKAFSLALTASLHLFSRLNRSFIIMHHD